MGYVSLALGAGTGPACPAGSEITFSIPLLEASVNVLTVASYNSATGEITVDQTLPVGLYDAVSPGQPYMVQVTTGSKNGTYAVIQSNTAGVITVLPQTPTDLDGLADGDSLTIRKAWTASTLIPTASVPDGVQISLFDAAAGVDISSTITLEKIGTNWINITASELGNDFVLYPGESFLLVNYSGTDVASLVVDGEVPRTNSVVTLSTSVDGSQDTRFSFVSPVTQEIQNAGFPAEDGDQVLVFDEDAVEITKSPLVTLEKNGPNWINITDSVLGNDYPLVGGRGYVYRRINASAGGSDIKAIATPSYLPLP